MGHFAEVRFTKMRLLLSLRFQTDPIIVLPGTIPNLSDFPTNQELTSCRSLPASIFAVAVILVIKSRSDYPFGAPTIRSACSMEWLESLSASADGAPETRLSFLVCLAGCDMRDYSEFVDWIPIY